MKLIMYVRKSSESEDRQVMSIDAQIHELNAQATRAGITLVGVPMSEEMSAKRPGRPVFAALLERIGRREADGILCWHLDRLARNPIDGAAIMWALSEGKVQAVVTPDRTYTGSGDDKLMMSIIFGMATKYSDDLSKNIRRGYQEALRRGEWPCSNVPIGYMRDPVTKLCVPDPERWEQLRQLWQLRITGSPVDELVQLAQTKMGLRTRPTSGRRRRTSRPPMKGHIISRAQMYNLFNNPFYAGMLRMQRNVSRGIHQPMVTAEDFLRAKERDQATRRAPTGVSPLPYRGLFRCGSCNHAMTVDRRTKPSGRSFIYLRCSGRAGGTSSCKAAQVSRAVVDAAVRDCLESMVLPREVVSQLVDALAGIQAAREADAAELERRRQDRIREIEQRRQRLLDAFLGGHLSEDELTTQRADLEVKRAAAAAPVPAVDAQFGPLKEQIFSLNDAVSRFEAGNDQQKSALVGALCSDRVVSDGKVLVSAVEPLRTLCRGVKNPAVWTLCDGVRTLLEDAVREAIRVGLPRGAAA